MKKLIVGFCLFLFISINSFAVELEKRNIEDFHALRIFGNFRVELIYGDSTYVTLQSYSIPLSKVTTEVEKGILKINMLSSFAKEDQISVRIFFKQLDEIILKGAASIERAPLIKSKFFNIELAQGAKLKLNIETENLSLYAYSGALITVSGKTNYLSAEISSGGMINALKMIANDVDATATAGGYVKVKAIEKLDAKANAGGKIYYLGEVKMLNQKVTLNGEVIKIEEKIPVKKVVKNDSLQ